MRRFVQQNELVSHARRFVENRVNSLESDAKHCLPKDPHDERIAPFPILLYCFATIDLLGALVAGRADASAPTPSQSKEYMRRFMSYSPMDADILTDLFRHKLVHLAQPNPLIKRGSEVITWRYWHNRGDIHLKKLPAPPGIPIHVTNDWTIPVTHEFHVSIMNFVNDIKNSTTKTKGYLDMLEKKSLLREKYQDAINQIYGE
jgi:hypothetical protein